MGEDSSVSGEGGGRQSRYTQDLAFFLERRDACRSLLGCSLAAWNRDTLIGGNHHPSSPRASSYGIRKADEKWLYV